MQCVLYFCALQSLGFHPFPLTLSPSTCIQTVCVCVFFLFVCFFYSAHVLTSDVSIEEMARAAEFFLSDGVIITGVATGAQADPQELRSILSFFWLHIGSSQKLYVNPPHFCSLAYIHRLMKCKILFARFTKTVLTMSSFETDNVKKKICQTAFVYGSKKQFWSSTHSFTKISIKMFSSLLSVLILFYHRGLNCCFSCTFS